jgi:hypothetical protein
MNFISTRRTEDLRGGGPTVMRAASRLLSSFHLQTVFILEIGDPGVTIELLDCSN